MLDASGALKVNLFCSKEFWAAGSGCSGCGEVGLEDSRVRCSASQVRLPGSATQGNLYCSDNGVAFGIKWNESLD